MRIELQFLIDKNELPIDYRRIFISFLKSCLSNFDGGRELENYYGPSKDKNYSFAVFFEKPQFLYDKVIFEKNRIKMVFSTSEKITGFLFYAAFSENKNSQFPLPDNNKMKLVNIKLLNNITVTGNQVLFRTASPLCIRKHDKATGKDFYYSCVHKEFSDEFLKVVRLQLKKAGFTEEDVNTLSIQVLWCENVIVKHYEYKIECTLGKFILEGTCDILQYLLDAGIGSRKSAGFGLLELMVQE